MVKLRQSGSSWNFHSETELEEFVWTNLTSLFGLLPLKRQHYVRGQFCDILAVGRDKQLVVIELKNEEDRYVVQQLTRYYHALQQEHPYQDQVDYSKPVRLIVIAPSFHRDNLIDRQYNHLLMEFLEFEIRYHESQFIWQLQDLDHRQAWHLNIPYQTQDSSRTIPPAPKKLLNRLAEITDINRMRILEIRQKLLGFDARIKETSLSSQILYGKGKNYSCAEYRFGSPFYSLSQPKKLNLLLWLPHPDRKQICRMLIDTKDWVVVDRLYYCPASSRRVHRLNFWWQNPALMVAALQEWKSEEQSYITKNYTKLLENPNQANSLDLLVEIALEQWVKRL